MKTLITEQQLNEYVLALYQEVIQTNSFFSVAFDLLYNTGCRWIEAFDLVRWTLATAPLYRLDTAKRNNDRIIDSTLFLPYTKYCLESNIGLYTIVNYPSCENYFNTLEAKINLHYNKKEIEFHAFRHAYFKNLRAQGKSIRQIMTITGETTESSVYKYLNSDLYIYDQY